MDTPMLRDIMDTPVKFDDRAVIVIPDLAVGELEIFLHNMYQHKVVFVVSKDVVELMRPICLSSIEDISDLHNYRDKDTDIDIDTSEKVLQQFQCDYCGKVTDTRQDLLMHIRNTHQVKENTCPICGKYFQMMEKHNLRITVNLGSKIHEDRLLKTVCLWNFKNIY